MSRNGLSLFLITRTCFTVDVVLLVVVMVDVVKVVEVVFV